MSSVEVAQTTAHDGRDLEAIALVEGDGVSLRIDDDSDTAHRLSRSEREQQCLLQQLGANAATLSACIDREPRDSQRGQGIGRKALAPGNRQAATYVLPM